MNGHPRDQAKLSVHCRWPLIRGTDGHVEMSRDIDNVAVNSRWPLTTGVAQGRYYCISDQMKLYFVDPTRNNVTRLLTSIYQKCFMILMLLFHLQVLCSSQTSCPDRQCCRNLMRTGRSGMGNTTSTTDSPTRQTANMGISSGIRMKQSLALF